MAGNIVVSGRGIRLTPAGQSIYKDAKFLFSFSTQAVARARAQMDAEKVVFRVGTSLLNPCKPPARKKKTPENIGFVRGNSDYGKAGRLSGKRPSA